MGTDADESELSEWESGNTRQGHKRKLDALVKLTVSLGLGREEESTDETPMEATHLPPMKTPRAFGTQPVGLRLPLLGPTPLDKTTGLSFGAASSGSGRCLPAAPIFYAPARASTAPADLSLVTT